MIDSVFSRVSISSKEACGFNYAQKSNEHVLALNSFDFFACGILHENQKSPYWTYKSFDFCACYSWKWYKFLAEKGIAAILHGIALS